MLLVGLATGLYTVLFARFFFQADTVMGGDTQVLWSLNHLALHALKAHGVFLWWDPTAIGGWPAYVNLTIGWFNYLSPYSMALLGPFTLFAPLLDLSVNQVLVFQKTIYSFALNATAAWLLSREILRSRAARLFVMLGFALGPMPFQGFRDSVLWEGMAPTLFLFWALVRLTERRDAGSLMLAYIFAALCAASLSYATLQVAVWWFFGAVLLMLVFFPAMPAALPALHRDLWRRPMGAAFLPVAALAIVAGLVAVAMPALFHLGELLRVFGFGQVDWDTNAGGDFGRLMAHHQGWSVLLTWAPFSDLHQANLGLKDVLGNLSAAGVDQRYLGIATLPLLLVALFRGERLPWLCVFALTWFFCALFIPYTRENQAIVALMDSAEVLRNIRTIANTLPRDVPSLFLLIAAGLGIDALLRGRSSGVDGWLRVMLTVLMGLALAMLLASLFPRFAEVRHSLGHLGIFLGAASLLCLVLTLHVEAGIRKGLAVALLLLVACDLTISSSSYWQRGLVWFRNEGPHRIPDLEVLRPVESSLQTWAGAYGGVIHNGYLGPILGLRPWLVLESRPDRLDLLPNWNAEIRTMRRYPDAAIVRDVAEVPFDTIRTIDSADLPDAAMLLHQPAPATLAGGGPLPGDSVALRRFGPNDLVFDVNAEQAGYLLLRDNFDRFWTATVDGVDSPVLRANFTQKAVLLPAGASVVAFAYDPWPVRLGWWAYYLLLAATIALSLSRGGRNRAVGLRLGIAAAVTVSAYAATQGLAWIRADQGARTVAAAQDPVAIEDGTLHLRGGRALPVRPGSVGALERIHLDPHGMSTISGWVIDPATGAQADGVHLFVGDRYWTSLAPNRSRPDIARSGLAGFSGAARGMDSTMIGDVRAFASFPGGFARPIGGTPARQVDPPWAPTLPPE